MFSTWERWDLGLAAIAAYIAVISLVRLMQLRREQLLVRFRREVEAEQRRLARDRAKPTAAAPKASGRDAA